MIATRRGQERAGAGVFFAGSNQRDSEAAGWNTRRSYISMNRAVGRGVARGDGGDPKPEAPLADTGFRGGFEYNCSCVLSGKHSLMPTPPQSRQHFAGSAGLVSRRSRASASQVF